MSFKQPGIRWILEPFLQFGFNDIYNPITDVRITKGDFLFEAIVQLYPDTSLSLSEETREQLMEGKWLIDSSTDILPRYNLRIVKIEGNSHCNQRCYFCPVSLDPKSVHTMSLELYEFLIKKISLHRETIQGVFMINFNEPSIDRFFLERIQILKKYDLPVCINTNATGLDRTKAEAILKMGGLRYLSVNLSTLDPEQYSRERAGRHLAKVRENIQYMNSNPMASEMAIAVLGENDEKHRMNYEQIRAEYASGYFEVKFFEIMDRAGALKVGQSHKQPISGLGGCDNLGSQPVQHLTVNAHGECIICCQDYFDEYKVGDLKTQSVDEIMRGEKMQKIRARLYGLEEAPEEFICRKCIFALSR